MAETPADPLDLSLDHLDLRTLFHLLSKQLGVVLARAELLEATAADASQRARAAQLVLARRLTTVIRDHVQAR